MLQCLKLKDHEVAMIQFLSTAKENARRSKEDIKVFSNCLNHYMATGDLRKKKIEWENKVLYLQSMLEEANETVSLLAKTEENMNFWSPRSIALLIGWISLPYLAKSQPVKHELMLQCMENRS